MSWSHKFLGTIGEDYISSILHTLPKEKYIVLDNVLLNSPTGTTQIDHIIVSVYGIFVIETKNYTGTIRGRRKGEHWIQYVNGRSYTIYNPLKQNHAHIMAIQGIFNIPLNRYVAIVVMAQACDVQGEAINCVIHSSQLLDVIKGFNTVVFAEYEMHYIASEIIKKKQNGFWNNLDHVANTQGKIKLKENKVAQRICPRCNNALVERNGQYGMFLGCSDYPRCKYTHKIL